MSNQAAKERRNAVLFQTLQKMLADNPDPYMTNCEFLRETDYEYYMFCRQVAQLARCTPIAVFLWINACLGQLMEKSTMVHCNTERGML